LVKEFDLLAKVEVINFVEKNKAKEFEIEIIEELYVAKIYHPINCIGSTGSPLVLFCENKDDISYVSSIDVSVIIFFSGVDLNYIFYIL
jgi:2-succinyl-5-enolpyruvyl-6-hydroxy-3-cyclohexene-1-carboxylate synthase